MGKSPNRPKEATDVVSNSSSSGSQPDSTLGTTPTAESPNVWRTILFTCSANLTLSVWKASVWPPLLKDLFHSNLHLGFVAAASGLGEVGAAVVSGWGSDRLGKELFLRIAAVVGMLSSVAVAAGVYWEHFATLLIASFASGAAYGAFFPVVEGIFADSVSAGKRTFIYNVKYGLERASNALAYVVPMCMFAGLGNTWRVSTMKMVIYAGVGASFLASMLLFTIKERYTLKNMALANRGTSEDEVKNLQQDEGEEGLLVNARLDDDADPAAAAKGVEEEDREDEEADAKAAEEAAQHERIMALLSKRAPGLLPQGLVPAAIAVRNVVTSLGSGMTVMFIALFLIDDYGVAPIALQGVLMIGSVLTVFASQATAAVIGDSGKCATPDGKPRVNRIRAMLVLHGIGVAGMFYLALIQAGPMASLWPILVVYTARYGIMNAVGGVCRSVMMDMVSPASRSRWNVVTSLSSATWAGSAIIGGAIADHWDYRATFLVTAALHAASWLAIAVCAMNRDRPPREVLDWLVDTGVVSPGERAEVLLGDDEDERAL